MLKLAIITLLALVVLPLLVMVSPLLLVYFLFDRLCDLIEEFKPTRSRRRRKSRAAGLGKVLNLIPLSKREQNVPNDTKGLQPTVSP